MFVLCSETVSLSRVPRSAPDWRSPFAATTTAMIKPPFPTGVPRGSSETIESIIGEAGVSVFPTFKRFRGGRARLYETVHTRVPARCSKESEEYCFCPPGTTCQVRRRDNVYPLAGARGRSCIMLIQCKSSRENHGGAKRN
jgi:hypothetical protein